jgi:cytochrome P450
VTDFEAMDFFRGDELVTDPYPYFDALREQCPVRREPHHGVVMVTGYEASMWQLADLQLDEFLDGGEGEFISGYAGPFTLLVIADLLGVPEQDREEFAEHL